MNKKGFTLIELLASLVILALIMLVAVPSTVNVLDRSKKQKYIQDAKRMITLAEAYIRGNESINYPDGSNVVVLYLSVLNDGTFDKDPDGNKYDMKKSFVTITKQGDDSSYTYEYSVQLVGVGSNGNRGVQLSSLADLNSDEKYGRVIKNVTEMNDCLTISKEVLETQCTNCCVIHK